MTLHCSMIKHVSQGVRRLIASMVIAVLALVQPVAGLAQEEITLNITDADIGALIDTVSQVTGRNFIVDPRVRAKVTVVSHQPMNADQLYKVFLSVLQVHGFATVDAGPVTKIVPDINAKQSGVPVDQSAGNEPGDEIITQIIPVQNVPVAQLVPILRPLVPQQGHLAAYPPTNVLIISDRANNIERMVEIVKRIDRAGDDEIEVIRLQHASASELVRIVGALQQQQGEQAGAPMRLAADERTNSLLLSGDKSARLRVRALIAHLDTPPEGGGDTRVVYLRYAKATELAPVLTGVSEQLPEVKQAEGAAPSGASSGGGRDADIHIEPDEATNALVITAPPKVQQSLEAIIRQLDVRRAQVLVEAAIAEISANSARELGVEFGAADTEGNAPAVGSFFDHPGNIRGLVNPTTLRFNPAGLGSGLSLLVGSTSGRYRFGALLRALAADTDSNILSTPSILTLDNQEAEIRVARNVPFITGQYTDGGTNANNPFTTVQREDVGVILKLKPQINEGNAITLDIEQEVSDVIQGTGGAGTLGPETNKRTIKTSVLVEDGQLIALGGLIDEAVQERERKVPLLGDLPLLGQLFRSNESSLRKRNLTLFLQPTILRSQVRADMVTQRKYNFIRAEQLAQRERGIRLLPGQESPLLPDVSRPELPMPFSSADRDTR